MSRSNTLIASSLLLLVLGAGIAACAPARALADQPVSRPAVARLPVCVVVRVTGLPEVTPAGSASLSASDTAGARQEASALALLAIAQPQLRLTCVIAPYLLDGWQTAAHPTGTASSQEATAADAATALDALYTAVSDGMPVLREGYGDPDLSGLSSISSLGTELTDQLALGESVTEKALGAASESTGAAFLDDVVPHSAGGTIADAGVSFVLLDPSSARAAGEPTVAPGAYRIAASASAKAADLGVVGLVIDREASALITTGDAGASLITYLSRVHARDPSSPVVIEVSVGPGHAAVETLAPALTRLAGRPWIALSTAPEVAARRPEARVTLAATSVTGTAPAAYWHSMRTAVLDCRALQAATGERDDSTRLAVKDLYLGESGVWSSADATSAGAAFIAEADGMATQVLSKVSVNAPNVTLPGNAGRLPVSVVNGSGKVLSVAVTIDSSAVRPPSRRLNMKLRPGENIVSVPVELGTSLRSVVGIRVAADGLDLASASTSVKASYLDRIVLVTGMVALLAGLLLYVWRRRRIAVGGTRDDSALPASRP